MYFCFKEQKQLGNPFSQCAVIIYPLKCHLEDATPSGLYIVLNEKSGTGISGKDFLFEVI